MTTLVIVESPAKCRKIEQYLGDGYKCMASFGHISELTGLKSIDVDNQFKPTFTPMESKAQQITKLHRAIQNAHEVVLAADDDREGEAIAWHICREFELPIETTPRIIFHEITKSALQRAIQNPTIINMAIVNAQQARQILDVIVGFRISPILWRQISKMGLSAGRCQTPALRLVYENQKDIDGAPGRKVYTTTGYFTSKNIPFQLNHSYDSEKNVELFLELTVNHEHIFSCSSPRSTTQKPPQPFTTSGLQQCASNELRISPKNTMKACQTLYEQGYITYMRTDSTTYSKEFVKIAHDFIDKTYGSEYKGVANTGKGGEEAHEAIRVTDIRKENVENMESHETRLYRLIRRNTLESCMPEAKSSVISATISSPEDHHYKYSTDQIVFPGWKVVAGYEKQNELYHYLQVIKKNSVLDYKKIISKVTMKDLKTHFTEARLVQQLEKRGIGRPSTFSSLIDKIQERGYVKKQDVNGKPVSCTDYELVDCEISEETTERVFGNEKGKLVIQPVGILVIEFLIERFDDLFQYEYTKKMEDTLDEIAGGNRIWHELCRECWDEIDRLSEGFVVDREMIPIDHEHTYMIGKYGPVIKCVKNNNTTFKSVRSDIDIEKLRNKEYTIDQLIENKTGEKIGNYKEKDIYLKKGKFGKYIEWGTIKKSVNENVADDITIETAIEILEKNNIIRVINEHASIRSGKYGDYIFYKKPNWKKPQFIKLNSNIDYMNCDVEDIIP